MADMVADMNERRKALNRDKSAVYQYGGEDKFSILYFNQQRDTALEMDQWFMYLTMNQTIYYLLFQLVFDQQNEDLFIIINTNWNGKIGMRRDGI